MMGKGRLAQPLARHLFLLFFWAVWLALPFIMIDDDDTKHRDLFIRLMPASLTNVLLFFVVGEWLGPRLLSQQRLKTYLLAVLGLSVVFIVGQGFLKNWLLFPEHRGVVFHMFRGMVQVFFAAALGAGYALVRHTLKEEKSRQEEQQERLQSELSFLRSQISPHFLFNILNSIVYLIRSKSSKAEPVTLQLSALMRYMLYESADAQIPLEKEIGHLKNYVELQRIRFEEDVEIRLDIEGQATAHIIEPMLMIPFVENAFKHGVGLVQSPEIEIRVKMTEKQLSFVARNKITADAAEDKDSYSGIGLQNVRRRLELLYPNAHKMETGEKDGWFEARLSIDFQT
ncbi:MAG: histidine kinase [Saprospiraceae bacterium]|nr:histidine kinase [Saprospiraceae bacterium]